MNSVEQIRNDLLSCRQKIQTLVIKDFIKLLPITKTTFFKNEVMKFPDLQDRLDFNLEKEKEKIFGNIRSIKQETFILKKKVKNFDRSQGYLEEVQQLTENIQNTTNIFKQNMMELFDQLADEEAQIESDLQIIDEFIEYSEQNPTVTTIPKPPLAKPGSTRNMEEKENKSQNQQDELTEMKRKIDRFEERILLNGGKLCGWEDEEHTQFLKVRTKYHGKVRTQLFLDECVNTIPVHSRDQICEHIDRFEKLCDLEDAKKILIAQYKQLKEDLKQKAIKKAEEETKQQVQQVALKKSNEQTQAEREKQKEDLKQWKMKRISQKMVEQDIDFERKQEEEKQKRQKMKQELEEKKIIVNQYKEQKQMLQLRQKEAEQYQSMMKRQVSQDVKERIRAREDEMTEKRIQKLEQDRQKQMEKQMKEAKKQEDKYIKYAYVEPKLLETTKAADQQKRTKFDPQKDQAKYANTFGGDLLGMGRRAIPNWRQGS